MNDAALLLASPSPCLRYLVLKEILHTAGGDGEIDEIYAMREEDPVISDIISYYGTGIKNQYRITGSIFEAAFHMSRLGFLGFDRSHPLVAALASFLFSRQNNNGSWDEHAGEDDRHNEPEQRFIITPLRTAFPLKGLAMCGYATEPAAEKAYDWLNGLRLEDGAWPAGITDGVYSYVAGYRRLAQSRWGCRSSTTGVLLCMAHHPVRRHSAESRNALDLLLGRETRELHNLGLEVVRMAGMEKPRGFLTYFARFDLALVLFLCAKLGAGLEDTRIKELVDYMYSRKGRYGIWENPAYPQASRWITFDVIRSLSFIQSNDGWITQRPRTPFTPYPKKDRRY